MKDRPSSSAAAGNSTWAARPSTGDWNTAANWTPAGVPVNTASFGTSSQTEIEFAPNSCATVDRIAFVAGAPSYTFTFGAPAPKAPALTIAGAGVHNESASSQRFVVASSAVSYTQPQLKFTNSASAGGRDVSYVAGPATPADAGGGVIGFCDQSSAGSATFTITTGAGTPKEPSTVGGEVSFSDSASAGSAVFTVYGSTSTTDGDTFGNAVFHDTSSAARATFTNVGGTVKGGDGGNTQFYDTATAASGMFSNMGGTVSGANGGDVAFDGTASAGSGVFQNYAATAPGGFGGVTSFNNNAPALKVATQGASAGKGSFYNYGATAAGQGGGHTFFTAKFGSPTAANGTFVNYGSAVEGNASCAGHTVLSISLPQTAKYGPDAGSATFWNFPGTVSGAPGGYTEFTVYANQGTSIAGSHGPRAGTATLVNLGAVVEGAFGGKTQFSGMSNAEKALLIATGGANGAAGGSIAFYDTAAGGSATVVLYGNGTLDVSGYGQPSLTIGELQLAPGRIATSLGTATPCVDVSGNLTVGTGPVTFFFTSGPGFSANTWYTILTAPNLSQFTAEQFSGNHLGGGAPAFRIQGNSLQVSYPQTRR
jgi:hypothetical protein